MKENWLISIISMVTTAALVASAFFGSLGLLIMAFKFFVKMMGGM